MENPTIRQLWPPGPVLFPTLPGSTVEGRPLLNLSFALNYAAGGLDPLGYHLVNLALHLAAGLALFGIVRRTLLLPAMRECAGGAATRLALAAAVLWVVHPLQTESVTNIVQRAESLMGVFYLFTLYCAIRGFTGGSPYTWKLAAIVVCLTGMAAKEVMATAPLAILLYDAAFLSGSVRAAFAGRRKFYQALMATWGLLALLALSAGSHGRTVGFGLGVSALDYAQTQCVAIL